MPTRSKFNEQSRTLIVSALRFGVSRRTAAGNAGIDPATLSRWLDRGRNGARDGVWKEFYQEVLKAEALAALSMAQTAYRGALDNPVLALKLLERIEQREELERLSTPLVVTLTLTDPPHRPLPHRPLSVIDVAPSELTHPDNGNGDRREGA
jgi:hypothetical protein